MIHGSKASGELYEIPQDYDIHGRVKFPRLLPLFEGQFLTFT
jgi:hypothetical protein